MTDARGAFHHGDLRAALIASGLELSRATGADAIVLREATRRAGVTARAAYRHFADRDALVRAVAQAALAEMARTIERRQQRAGDPVAILHALGVGYIQFALDEPGWFDVAFFAMADMLNTTAAESAGATGRSPYQQLEDALAGLVRAGLLDPALAPNAALVCWSGVHGFATLTSHGPLRGRQRSQVDQQAEYLVGYLVQSVVTIPPRPVA